MNAVVRQEVRKLTGRRGSFWSALAVTVLLAGAIVVISVIVDGAQDDATGGKEALDVYTFLFFVPLVPLVLVAAQAGAWDFANGTFRYMAVTHRSRGELLGGTAVAAVLMTLGLGAIYCAVGLTQAFTFPTDFTSADASGRDALAFLWFVGAQGTFWVLMALAVGVITRSTGAGIAIGLVLYFGGFAIGAIIGVWSEPLRDLLPNFAITRITLGEGEQSLAAGIVTAAAWLGGMSGFAVFRTVRSEY